MSEYIEREAAIDAVFGAMADGRAVFPTLNNIPAADVVSKDLFDKVDWERIVAVSQIPAKGQWELKISPTRYQIGYQHCSVCGCPQFEATPFCPNCGADMREAEDEP